MSEEKGVYEVNKLPAEELQALAQKPLEDEYAIAERFDEQLILQELAGEVEETIKATWFYRLPSGTIGISWAGIKAFKNRCALMGFPINVVSVEQVSFAEQTEAIFKGVEAGIYTKEEAREKLDYFTGRIFFNAIVEDTRTKQRTSGISSAPLKTYAKGKMIEDEFASVKAHNKAVRNSIEMLMTAEAKATLLMIAMKQGYKPTKLEKLTEIVTKQPASEKQKSEIEFLLVEKGMSIAEAEAKLSEKFNREIKIDFSTMTAKQAAWIIKELATS